MSKRVRTNTVLIPIKDWQEADDHIKRIGTVQDEIVKAEIEAGKKIDAIKEENNQLWIMWITNLNKKYIVCYN